MKFAAALVVFVTGFLFAPVPAPAQGSKEFTLPKAYRALESKASPELQKVLDTAINETIAKFADKGFKAEHIAATLIDMRNPKSFPTASFRGEEKIYPASVVKMFYMAALEQWLADKRVKPSGELDRGLKDMIVDSSNEATQYILDVLSGVSSGPQLPQKQFAAWSYKRNVVNRYFSALGYQNINVNQKTFCEDAYGIEQQFRGDQGVNRNKLTTNATARLLAEIVLGRMGGAESTSLMVDLMKRDPFAATKDNDDQAHGFTGIALINKNLTGAKLWSKAGWTSQTRHDAAYIELPDGRKFVLVVFTEKFAGERNIIPAVAERVIDGLGAAQ
ncbi:MAG: serine hydrolase [Acidobacteria bacterium]|nr:serine hydrolase [Acidobacteriota bacterium]MBK8147085.1 serine hydrolase [Acidobacteriota bacterium]MBK8812360.1 serine hydrolase [Acidobacteriota bacterium]